MSDEITIDGEQFVSSKRASELSGYKQDYIGQLSRGGQILARRVGGLWYISSDSLTKYKEHAEAYKPVPPVHNAYRSDPDSLLSFDGMGYISASRAAKLTGYSPDYVGQMARAGIIPSRQVGNRWYVEQAGIISHKEKKDSLLAAVQAESVGLKTGDREAYSDGYSTDSPFFQYTSDNRELLPAITSADQEFQDKEDIDEEEFVIPIRVYHGREEKVRKMPINMPIAVEPRRAMLPMVLTASLFTIVILLSLGFVSLKKSSIYTNNAIKEGFSTAQLASASLTFINKAGDLLETWIVPELVYRRPR